MSCNGCRVLRKGCSDACILRSSLRWIESPEAQGHATVFVAKFFGRAGMMSFINAVSESQRPALFQSLLYEACGRIVNPVFGAVGLLWSGNWGQCQAAVETVLKGGSPQPAAACMPALPNKPAHTTACRPNLPPATSPFSRPSTSFYPVLDMPMPQSAQPITQEPPLKRAKSFVQQREQRPPQQEVSNVTSEAVSLSQERSNGLIFRHANQNSSSDFSEIIKCREHHESTTPCGQLHAPVPRRVKQKPQSPNSPSFAIFPEQTWKEEDAAVKQAVHNTIELDLTLNSHGNHADIGGWKLSSLPLMPVSSPSSFSVNSEGSVTNSDTAEYTISCLRTLSAQAQSHAEDRKLLRLL